MASFLLAFREALEAALVVTLMLSFLVRAKRPQLVHWVWVGVGSGALLSIVAAYLFTTLIGEFEGLGEQLFEGILMLTAAGLLTTMIFWMARQGSSVSSNMRNKLEASFGDHENLKILALATVAILREGVELVLFLSAARVGSDVSALWTGLAGIGAATLLGYLMYRGTVRLNLKQFFNWMGVVLVIFAAGLVAHGVHELNEAKVIPEVIEHVWNINGVLNENSTLGGFLKALVGYNGNPSLTEVGAWILYFVLVGRNIFSRRHSSIPA